MLTRSFVDYNGTVPEKYDVVRRSHHVTAEYGNVGTDFAYRTREGFGWMNASYQARPRAAKRTTQTEARVPLPAEGGEWVLLWVGGGPVVQQRSVC
jgi:hypothetical protein